MESKSGVYAIKLNPEKLVYIGSTSSLRLRKNNHTSCIKRRDRAKGCEAIIDAVQRGNYYKFIILEYVEIEKLEQREQYWINQFKLEGRWKVINTFDATRKSSKITEESRIKRSNAKRTIFSTFNIFIFDLQGNFINAYISTRQAASALSIPKTGVAAASKGHWRYKYQYKNYIIINYGVLYKLDELLETHQILRAISSEAKEKCKMYLERSTTNE